MLATVSNFASDVAGELYLDVSQLSRRTKSAFITEKAYDLTAHFGQLRAREDSSRADRFPF